VTNRDAALITLGVVATLALVVIVSLASGLIGNNDDGEIGTGPSKVEQRDEDWHRQAPLVVDAFYGPAFSDADRDNTCFVFNVEPQDAVDILIDHVAALDNPNAVYDGLNAACEAWQAPAPGQGL